MARSSPEPDVRLVLGMLADLKLPDRIAGRCGRARFRRSVQRDASRRSAGRRGRRRDARRCRRSLAYRLYRPATPGPHPIVVYFHGGGWVLGDAQSDDPFCRDLCRRSGMVVLSVDYRHAPEHRFPAAAEDGHAALRWVADHGAALGGRRGRCWSRAGAPAATSLP